MKKLITFRFLLSVEDVRKAIANGWKLSTYTDGRNCLENSKTIFLPASMPKI